MKIVFFILLILANFLFFTACSEDNQTEPVQKQQIDGLYNLVRMSWASPGDTITYNQAELEDMGAVWNLHFNTDGTFEQISNMTDGTMQTNTGTWNASGNQLTLIFTDPAGLPSIVYTYLLENSILFLTRTFNTPEGEITIFADFSKSQ
jgi:hypothetical protein